MEIIQGNKEAEALLKISSWKRKKLEKALPSPKIKSNGRNGGVSWYRNELAKWYKSACDALRNCKHT